MTRDVLRLAGLLAAVALATSRIGLIGHELVGHGGVALAAGAQVTEVELFWFAGGWIRYALPQASLASVLAIAMAGIALELVIGMALWLGVRPKLKPGGPAPTGEPKLEPGGPAPTGEPKLEPGGPAPTGENDTLGRRIVRGVGTGLVVHATWYLATGAFLGFGDGVVLYRVLGDARVPVAIAAGIATCTATFLGARAIVAPLARTLPGTTRQRAAGFAIAALLGGGLHAALTFGELRLRRDATYSQVMRTERDRRIALELQAWERDQAARGAEPSPTAQRVERVRLERTHQTFPFVVVLAVATLASMILGIARTRGGRDERVANGLLVRAVAVALASICAVIVLGAVLPG